jgi:hypothetical protein
MVVFLVNSQKMRLKIAEKLSKNMRKLLFLAISQNFAKKVHNSTFD